jgi:glucosamine--fructose-6-phosphate aminotransferase (isomerizing)
MRDDATGPGHHMASELAEQPRIWRGLVQRHAEFHAIGPAIAARSPRFVQLAARGTSDHTALYAKYLVEILHGLPAGLVSPSTMTAYGAARDVMLIAVSQSGGSPDLVQTVEIARRGGALTLAVTNSPASALAAAAELDVDVMAGAEKSVVATKSYTAQLLALYLILEHWRGGDASEAHAIADLGDTVLHRAQLAISACAPRYRFAQRMVVTGRGYAYPTAREAALKLMETSYVSAQAFSGADLLHGPLALLDPLVPVLAIIPQGVAGAAMAQVIPRVRQARADLFVVGTREAVAQADAGFALPEGTPEVMSPLLEILPFQILALHVAVERGEDPDTPRGLRKITKTT